MTSLIQKLKIVYARFLVIAICFIIGYTFLHWLLLIKFSVFNIKEEVVNFWLPIALVWIPLLIWLNPRVKLFRNKTKSGKSRNPAMGYLFFASFAIAAPTIIAQTYLETATGKLTSLSSVGEIITHAPTKYYTIKSFYIDKESREIKYTSDVTGKHNEDLNLHIYIASPIEEKVASPTNTDTISLIMGDKKIYVLDGQIVDSATLFSFPKDSIASINVLKGDAAISIYGNDAANGVVIIKSKYFASLKFTPPANIVVPTTWLCVNYSKGISNRLSDSTTKQLEDDFYHESLQNFDNRELDSFVYLDRVGNTDDRAGYVKAIEKLAPIATTTIILEPNFDAFENRNGNKFPWIFGSLGIGMAVLFLLLLVIKFDEDKLNHFLTGKETTDSETNDFLKFIIPKEGFYVTPILIYINVGIFLAMVFAGLGFASFDIQGLLNWGADYGPYTKDGQWWRLLTNIFVHAGFMHLVLNMYGLLFVGIFLEPVIGKTKYAIAYLVTGIIASIASLYWHTAIVSVGASGAIFGLYGVFVALLLLKVFPKNVSMIFLLNASIFIIYNLVIGLTVKGTDNAAHIGGLLSGFIVGLLVRSSLTKVTEDDTVENFK